VGFGNIRQSRASSTTPSTTTCKGYHAQWKGQADVHSMIVIWEIALSFLDRVVCTLW
jgi:hypothetical protein